MLKSKIKKKGNEILPSQAINPYYIAPKKVAFPLWAKIAIPSSLVAMALVISLSLTLTRPSSDSVFIQPKKAFNEDYQNISKEFIDEVNRLTIDQFAKVSKRRARSHMDEWHGVLMSPLSVAIEYSLLYEASSGETKDYYQEKMPFVTKDYYLDNMQRAILNYSVDNADEYGNRFYSNTSNLLVDNNTNYDFDTSYIDIVTKYLFADVYSTNCNSEELDKFCSDYIESKTGIEQSFQFNALYSNVFLMLLVTNFSSSWHSPIVLNNSLISSFSNYAGPISEGVQYFRTSLETSLIETDDYYLFQIPLECGFNFDVLYPKDSDDYKASIENNVFSIISFNKEVSRVVHLNLMIPEFTLLGPSDFQNIGTAEYGRIVNGKESSDVYRDSLHVSEWSLLEVSRNGIIASTNSSVYQPSVITPVIPSSELDESVSITLNHPFLFSISRNNSIPLFIGELLVA